MNAVGIDVSKGESMMIALQPINQVVLKPREYPHTEVGLEQMAHDILRTCIDNLNPSPERVLSRHTSLNFLAIHTSMPAKICLVWRQNPSPIRRFRM